MIGRLRAQGVTVPVLCVVLAVFLDFTDTLRSFGRQISNAESADAVFALIVPNSETQYNRTIFSPLRNASSYLLRYNSS